MANTPPSQPTSEQEAEDPRHLDRQMVKWTRVVGWFTALLFIANVAGLFFIWEQWRVASKSQIDTREQLRAAVGFQTTNEQVIVGKDGKIASLGIQAQFNNAGGTRTAVFRAWFSVQYFDKAEPNNLDFSKPYTKVDITDNILPAGGVSNLETVGFSAEYIDKVVNKEGVALYWGHSEWADIFTPSDIHVINFCFRLEPVTLTDGKIVVKPITYKPDCNNSKSNRAHSSFS
jgi:hypothetical protein